jgi:chorismate mutase
MEPIWCRGIRGAITTSENTREAILQATHELLTNLIEANGIQVDDVASAIFTTTPDLDAEFPAVAAREIGWSNAALMCGQEMKVPGSLPRCIRILIHWNTTRRADEIVHVYLREARMLRPEHAQRENEK